MTTERPSEDTDAHTALLTTRWGKVVVGVLLAAMAVWIVAPNMPAGPARDSLDVVWSPAIDAGLEQNWAVFSPNPRGQSIEVIAVLEYADGSMAIWSVPDFDPVVGAYRSYRWRKWQERVRLDVNSEYWDVSAEWIAERNRRDGLEEGR